jgi:hypothetical protein
VGKAVAAAMTSPSLKTTTPSLAPPQFSLVLGGLLFRLYRRAHLSGESLEFLRRRVLCVTLLAWLPLLVLSAIDGNLHGGVRIPFLNDVEAHVRFLAALPLAVASDVESHDPHSGGRFGRGADRIASHIAHGGGIHVSMA